MLNLALVLGTLATAIGTSVVTVNKGSTQVFAESDSSSTFSYYKGHERRRAHYDGMDYIYSDGVFEDDPYEYSPHMAALAAHMVNASDNYVRDGKYDDGAHTIKAAYQNMGFRSIYVNDGYTHKPTTDSIGFIAGHKSVFLNRKDMLVEVISITIRSAGYEQEWASNVKLGTSGEAEGFKEAADQVKEGVDFYLFKSGLDQYVNNGGFIFFVQGFSRGGATANLVAKRLIDDYQHLGHEIVAYCMEAPQGGVASAEREGSDYRSIHNVINVDDFVPYVAPTVMGFKRYGVDHYVFDETYDSNSLKKSSLYPNNDSDNNPVEKASSELKSGMLKQLEMIEPNETLREKHKPYAMTMYELSITSFSIGTKDSNESTSHFLRRFMDGFANTTTRNEYATKGLQNALRNFMIYTNSGGSFSDFTNAFTKLGIASLVGDIIVPSLIAAAGSGIAALIDDIIEILGGDPVCAEYLSKEFSKELASKLAEKIASNCNSIKSLDSNYPGKTAAAKKDISVIAAAVINGLPCIDDIITLFKGIEKVNQNHSFLQSIAYLRALDDWYDYYEKPIYLA